MDGEQHAIDTLVGALRRLEERAASGRAPSAHVVGFLAALDRRLTPGERAYAAAFFAARRDARDLLVAALQARLGAPAEEVVRSMKAHFASASAGDAGEAGADAVGAELWALRRNLLRKVLATAP